jgi:hypothetical protein
MICNRKKWLNWNSSSGKHLKYCLLSSMLAWSRWWILWAFVSWLWFEKIQPNIETLMKTWNENIIGLCQQTFISFFYMTIVWLMFWNILLIVSFGFWKNHFDLFSDHSDKRELRDRRMSSHSFTTSSCWRSAIYCCEQTVHSLFISRYQMRKKKDAETRTIQWEHHLRNAGNNDELFVTGNITYL